MATGVVDQAEIVPSVMTELAYAGRSVRMETKLINGGTQHDTRIH